MALMAMIMVTVSVGTYYSETSMDGADTVEVNFLSMTANIGGTTSSSQTWYIMASGFLAVGLLTYSITQYKNRLLQMKLGAVISAVIAGNAIAIVVSANKADALIANGLVGFHYAYYMPIAALLLNMISNRLIRKDEQMVRSMDRLR